MIHICISFAKMKDIQITSLYRPPNSDLKNFVDDLTVFLSNVNYNKNPFIIVGDLIMTYLKLRRDKMIYLIA